MSADGEFWDLYERNRDIAREARARGFDETAALLDDSAEGLIGIMARRIDYELTWKREEVLHVAAGGSPGGVPRPLDRDRPGSLDAGAGEAPEPDRPRRRGRRVPLDLPDDDGPWSGMVWLRDGTSTVVHGPLRTEPGWTLETTHCGVSAWWCDGSRKGIWIRWALLDHGAVRLCRCCWPDA